MKVFRHKNTLRDEQSPKIHTREPVNTLRDQRMARVKAYAKDVAAIKAGKKEAIDYIPTPEVEDDD